MTLSLAAVFIPLVFLPGLLGRIFREFSVTIIVAILASGLISLTLTPLMCARMLREHQPGHKRSRMERWTGDFIKRVTAAYGRALDRFLDRAWLAAPILIICILGLWFFFTHLPFTLLPVGDSGSARGVFIAQEGTSPEQMRVFQKQVNEKIIAEPSVGQFFTVAGSAQRSAASQGVTFVVFKPRNQREPIEQCLLRLQKSIATIPRKFNGVSCRRTRGQRGTVLPRADPRKIRRFTSLAGPVILTTTTALATTGILPSLRPSRLISISEPANGK